MINSDQYILYSEKCQVAQLLYLRQNIQKKFRMSSIRLEGKFLRFKKISSDWFLDKRFEIAKKRSPSLFMTICHFTGLLMMSS